MQIPTSIAIQGEPGSFSYHAATLMHPQATIRPCALSAEVFEALASGTVDAAVIPIENSLAGSVVEHYDLLFRYDVVIERELLLRIRHNLIAAPGVSLGQIERVLSHPVALAQCRSFLLAHRHMEPVPFYDTAGSVKHILELGEAHSAAIASQQAAAHYCAQVLVAGIEDDAQNYTRFFLVRRRDEVTPNPPGTKVSLAFTVENRPGTLVAALQLLARHQTNLSKIESRPVPGEPWHYIFYVDYQVPEPAAADAALADLRQHCRTVKELGRYEPAPGRELAEN